MKRLLIPPLFLIVASIILFSIILSLTVRTQTVIQLNRPTLLPDFAGIYVDGDGSVTVTLVHAFEQITSFNTDMPETVSDGAHGTDNITIGATGVYEVIFTAGARSASVNKVFEFFAFEKESSSAGIITGITEATPGVVTTASDHNLENNDRIIIEGVSGMTGVNGKMYTVTNKTTDTFQLYDDNSNPINTTTYGTWSSSSGTVTEATKLSQIHAHRKFGTNSDEGAFGGAGLVSLTANKTLELWFKGTSDATNLTIQECSFYIKRLQ